MSKKDEALKLALEALKKCDFALAEELAAWDIEPPLHHVLEASNACGPAITAIREALAEQPAQQQEPVACAAPMACSGADKCVFRTSPPTSKPLTNEQALQMSYKHEWLTKLGMREAYRTGIRDAESAHGIKGDA